MAGRKEYKTAGGTKSSKELARRHVHSPAPTKPQIRRVSFLISDSVLTDIRALAGPDETMTDVFKKAVASLKYLEDRRKAGKRFFVGERPDAIESEVVLLR